MRTELSWIHYRIISWVDDEQLRMQYMAHSIEGNWDTRTLQRNIKTNYLGRALQLPDEKQNLLPTHFLNE